MTLDEFKAKQNVIILPATPMDPPAKPSPEPEPTPTPEQDKRTVEEWAETKLEAHETGYQRTQSEQSDNRPWHRERWYAATKAIRGWAEGQLVTEAEFDAALHDARHVRIG